MIKQTLNVHVRWAIRLDMPRVLEIENASFKHAWTKDDFLDVLKKRNCIGSVAVCGEIVVGFFVYELHKNSIDILNIAVHPQWRLKRLLSSHRRTKTRIVLSDSNLDAHLFFKACGFVCLEVLKGHFENGDDGYKFVYRLDE